MGELTWTLIGLVLGIAGDEAFRFAKEWIKRHNSSRRKTRLRKSTDPSLHAGNIVQIFHQNGIGDSLYRLSSTQDKHVVSVLDGGPMWQGKPGDGWPFLVADKNRVALPYDARIIDVKMRAGVELWDGSLMYSVSEQPLTIPLPVGVCNYFAHVDLAERIQNESRSIEGSKPILTNHFRTFNEALTSRIKPIVLAAAVACVFETNNQRLVALQTRSEKVVNQRGQKALTPVFGIEPNFIGRQNSRYDLITYNTLKEILEEFHGAPDLDHVADRPSSPHPDYIFQTSHGRALTAELEHGGLDIQIIGTALNLTDGSLTIAVMAHFKSQQYFDQAILHAQGNWEADDTAGTPKIQLYELQSRELEREMTSGIITNSSTYALDLARSYFEASL